MEKNQLLDDIRQAAAEKLISKQELLSAYDSGAEKNSTRIMASTAFLYIGGLVVFFGLVLLVGNNWNQLNAPAKAIVSFGPTLIAFYLGFFFNNNTDANRAASFIMYVISMLLLPIAVYATLSALGMQFVSRAEVISYELSLAIIYGLFAYASKRKMFMIPLVFSLTALFFTGTDALFNIAAGPKFYQYRFLVVGVAYLLLANYYSNINKIRLSKFWNIFGFIVALGAALALGGYRPFDFDQILWEIAFPILVFIAIYYSVYIKNTGALALSALFLIIYILKITAEYFSTGLGWPLAVVLAGLLIMAVGYVSVYVNRRYIKSDNA